MSIQSSRRCSEAVLLRCKGRVRDAQHISPIALYGRLSPHPRSRRRDRAKNNNSSARGCQGAKDDGMASDGAENNTSGFELVARSNGRDTPVDWCSRDCDEAEGGAGDESTSERSALLCDEARDGAPTALQAEGVGLERQAQTDDGNNNSATTKREDKLRWRQSTAYILVFICAGLVVGVTGPALPWIKEQLPEGANLGHAFALRGLGGLLGSFGGAWALHCGVPGGIIMAAAGVLGALGAGSFRVCDSVAGVAVGLILLDIGCGFMQVANTMYAWIHPEKYLVGWLNLLNAAFGIGTLLAPAVVALLATLSASHSAGLLQALIFLPALAFTASAGTLLVPSPRQPVDVRGATSAGGGWGRWVGAVLTAMALNGAVGAETTFGAFLVAYITSQREAGLLSIGEREADMMTSAFWLAFTLGRLAAGALSAIFSRRPTIVLWAQIVVMCGGLIAAAAFPSSRSILWAGAILMGSGVGGLFAGFMGQFNSRYFIDSKTGGLIGVGVMAGIAFWQATAAMCHPADAIHVTLAAAGMMVASQCMLQLSALRRPPHNTSDVNDTRVP